MKVLDVIAFISLCFSAGGLMLNTRAYADPIEENRACNFVCKMVYYGYECGVGGRCEVYYTQTCAPCRGINGYNCYGTTSSGDTCQASEEYFDMAFYDGCEHCPCGVGRPVQNQIYAEARPPEDPEDIGVKFRAMDYVRYCVG